jgi:PadR family transcriptional regulator PadR
VIPADENFPTSAAEVWGFAGAQIGDFHIGLLAIAYIYRPSTYDGQVKRTRVQMLEPTYFVLVSLLDGPLHGYAIIKRTAELSDGRVQLATGTLYTALDRLTAEGHVELVREEIVHGRARRSYGLTPSGAGVLRAEATRMAAAARLVTRQGRDLKADGNAHGVSPA